ncbi:MAG: MoaD/ThiS family protein [Thermoleophilia bacterium]|nr:MoaD/ThiS family protein [Thermoleophilia bacterium]
MMNVTVKLFAGLRERAGTGTLEVDVPEGTTAGVARDVVGETAGLGDLLTRQRVALAVNRRYADDNLPLRDGDELALIPPVSGG